MADDPRDDEVAEGPPDDEVADGRPDEVADGPPDEWADDPPVDLPPDAPGMPVRPRAPAAATADLPPGANRPVRYVREASITVELPAVGADGPTTALPFPPPRARQPRQAPPGPRRPPGPPPRRHGPPAVPPPALRADQLPGLVVAVLGLVCVLLSLLVLDWASGGDGTFLDIAGNVRRAGSGAVGSAVAYAYPVWLAWLLLVLTVVAVLLAGRPLPGWRSGSAYPRIGGTVVAAIAALLQTVTITHLFRGPPSPQFGAWIGVGGYLVVIVGFVLGTNRRS